MEQKKIEEFIRDVTQAHPGSKAEVRKRLNEILEQERGQHEKEKCEIIKDIESQIGGRMSIHPSSRMNIRKIFEEIKFKYLNEKEQKEVS